MVPVCDKQVEDPSTAPPPPPPELREYRIQIPSLNESLIADKSRKRRLLDFLKAGPSYSMEWFKKLRFPSSLKIFWQKIDEREEVSMSVPLPISTHHRHFHINFMMRKINWASVFTILKEWCENPMNIALSLWLLCVAVSGSMLILLLLGVLDTAFPTKVMRNYWIEINNQVLNALFTLMSVYQHPSLIHHLYLLFCWGPEDVTELRKLYCKDGLYRPHEYAHITVVVCLLHVTCFCQYMLCGLYWGYSRKQRPEWAENMFFILGTVTPVVAAMYTICSPLGKEYDHLDTDVDESKHVNPSKKTESESASNSFPNRMNIVSKPEWVGGLFDCRDDPTAGFLSCFCTFCVFGWNMERLGFGNMYVHIVTFILLCIAPFWIFSISAMHIHNYVIGDIVGVAGILLCAFGLLYGGYWRIQMRKKFKLPSDHSTVCCGSVSVTDYMKWMFCWGFALAQEVRTGNFYDVEDDSFFYRKLVEGNCEVIVHQDGAVDESEPLDLNSTEIKGGADVIMDAPIQPLIELQTELDANCVDSEF